MHHSCLLVLPNTAQVFDPQITGIQGENQGCCTLPAPLSLTTTLGRREAHYHKEKS